MIGQYHNAQIFFISFACRWVVECVWCFFWRDLSPVRGAKRGLQKMVSRWIWGETGIRAVAADARWPTQKSGLHRHHHCSSVAQPWSYSFLHHLAQSWALSFLPWWGQGVMMTNLMIGRHFFKIGKSGRDKKQNNTD